MTVIDAPLAGALQEGRERFNALAAEARLMGGGFVEDAFTDALTGPVDALATAVAAHDPAAVGPVVDVAYRAALLLTARGERLDDRRSPLARLWSSWAALTPLVARAPQRLIGSLSNAALAITGTRGTDPDEWLGRLLRLAAHDAQDPARLLDAGRLAAWACGMAHLRPSALAGADGLSAELTAIAVMGQAGASVDLSDPWSPVPQASDLVTGHRAGDFVGLDGPFTLPPVVWVADDGTLHASAAPQDGTWRIHADAFGTTLTRSRAERTFHPGQAQGWPGPAEPLTITSSAATGQTLAWTVDASYRVRVQGRVGGSSR